MKKIDLASVKGAGIHIADQNHYNYADFTKWLKKMRVPIKNEIRKNPNSVPYLPKYIKNKNFYRRWEKDTKDNKIYGAYVNIGYFSDKQAMINHAKYWYHVFGLESIYTYKRGKYDLEYHIYPLPKKPNFYHPITFQWFTGTKPKKTN